MACYQATKLLYNVNPYLKIGYSKFSVSTYLSIKVGCSIIKLLITIHKDTTIMLSSSQTKVLMGRRWNWYRDSVTIKLQTFCGLKETELKTIKEFKSKRYKVYSSDSAIWSSLRQ